MRRSSSIIIISMLTLAFVPFTRADFGQAIVDEAVDLFAAQLAEDAGDDLRSMEDLLHWAISHSDPEKLAAQAEEAQRIQMVRDLKEQRRRVKELLDHVRSQPTETDMMKEGIAILQRAGASETELLAALQALQVLVEPIDNANDLQPLGGVTAVVAQLTRGSSQLAAAAAHVLGTASSNNPAFQRHLLAGHPDIIHTLLQVSQSLEEEAAVKGMYALAALVRNLPEARRAFTSADGFGALEVLLRGQAVAARVKRKALSLFTDLVDTHPAGAAEEAAMSGASGGGPTIRTLHDGVAGGAASAAAAASGAEEGAPGAAGAEPLAAAALSAGLPQAVVSLLLQPDADMQEKALLVMQRLAGDPAVRRVLRESGAVDALAALIQQLKADAPKPWDEPDLYHDYLVGLAGQVAVLMARPDVRPGGEDVRQHQHQHQHQHQGSGAAAGAANSVKREEQGGRDADRGAAEEQPQQVLALGGPPVAVGRQEGSRGRAAAAVALEEAGQVGQCSASGSGAAPEGEQQCET